MIKTVALALLSVSLIPLGFGCAASSDDQLQLEEPGDKADGTERPFGVFRRELAPSSDGFTMLHLSEDRTYEASQELARCDPGACTNELSGEYRFASSHGNRYIVLYEDGDWSYTFQYELSQETLRLAYRGSDSWWAMVRDSERASR